MLSALMICRCPIAKTGSSYGNIGGYIIKEDTQLRSVSRVDDPNLQFHTISMLEQKQLDVRKLNIGVVWWSTKMSTRTSERNHL